MSLMGILLAAQGARLIENLASAYGNDRDTTQNLVEKVLPVISDSLKKRTGDKAGVEQLKGFVDGLDIREALYAEKDLQDTSLVDKGNSALDYLLARSNLKANLVNHLIMRTGLAAPLVGTLVPAIATLALSGLANQPAWVETESRLGRLPKPRLIGRFFSMFSRSAAPTHAGEFVFGAMIEAGVKGDEEWVVDAFTPKD